MVSRPPGMTNLDRSRTEGLHSWLPFEHATILTAGASAITPSPVHATASPGKKIPTMPRSRRMLLEPATAKRTPDRLGLRASRWLAVVPVAVQADSIIKPATCCSEYHPTAPLPPTDLATDWLPANRCGQSRQYFNGFNRKRTKSPNTDLGLTRAEAVYKPRSFGLN